MSHTLASFFAIACARCLALNGAGRHGKSKPSAATKSNWAVGFLLCLDRCAGLACYLHGRMVADSALTALVTARFRAT